MTLSTLKVRGLSDADALRVMHGVVVAAKACNVKTAHILSRGGNCHIQHARKVAMYETSRLNISLSMIGRGFQRDHTTVMSAVRSIAEQRGAQ